MKIEKLKRVMGIVTLILSLASPMYADAASVANEVEVYSDTISVSINSGEMQYITDNNTAIPHESIYTYVQGKDFLSQASVVKYYFNHYWNYSLLNMSTKYYAYKVVVGQPSSISKNETNVSWLKSAVGTNSDMMKGECSFSYAPSTSQNRTIWYTSNNQESYLQFAIYGYFYDTRMLDNGNYSFPSLTYSANIPITVYAYESKNTYEDAVKGYLDEISGQLDSVNKELDNISGLLKDNDESLGALLDELESIDSELNNVTSQLKTSNEHLTSVESKLDELYSRLGTTNSRLSTIIDALTTTNAHLEELKDLQTYSNRTFDSLTVWLSAKFLTLTSWYNEFTENMEVWISNITERLDNIYGRLSSILNHLKNQTEDDKDATDKFDEDSQEQNDELGQLTEESQVDKVDIDDTNDMVDDALDFSDSPQFSNSLLLILNNDLIKRLMLLSLGASLIAYVLYGKR